MTPRKRAEIIIKRTISLVNDWNEEFVASKTIDYLKKDQSHRWHRSKRVALNTVNLIIGQWEYVDIYLADLNGELNPNLKYWYDVKKEINSI